MRKSLVLATLSVMFIVSGAFAGVPDPARSGCELKGQGASCQFRFRADGGLDCLTVCITLRDAFDTPVPNCSTNAGIGLVGPKPANGCWAAEPGAAICACDSFGLNQGAFSDSTGVVQFVWKCIGGRGIAELCVTAHCVGVIEMCCHTFHFTSPDLDASCDAAGSATNVIDLGIWAACLPPSPPCESADYNCDCVVNVLDLGVFAGGLGVSCADCPL
jgi:hypothetical protein